MRTITFVLAGDIELSLLITNELAQRILAEDDDPEGGIASYIIEPEKGP